MASGRWPSELISLFIDHDRIADSGLAIAKFSEGAVTLGGR